MIDETGWWNGAKRVPSPNFNARPAGVIPDLLVIHSISLPPGRFGGGYIEDFFCNRLEIAADPYFEEIGGMRVSAHMLIDRSGGLTQFVSFRDRAWHAGESCFDDRVGCNDYSIGIELEGTDTIPYTDGQYRSLVTVYRGLLSCYPGITTDRVVGHCDIAPDRKTDPGPAFDWAYFRGLAAFSGHKKSGQKKSGHKESL